MQPTGYILWQGPSKLDGSPIAAVATLGSDNRKTGDMVQTYILRTDMPPGEAVRSGADAAVCGNCKLRPYNGGGCYVVIYHGPRSVYAKLERGGYLMAGDLPALGRGCTVRLGSYGDPAAVPSEIWRDLISEADGHTGYTHQWRNSQDLRDFLMASVDSPEEREEALARGWRTFRVRQPRAGAGAPRVHLPGQRGGRQAAHLCELQGLRRSLCRLLTQGQPGHHCARSQRPALSPTQP